MRTSETFGRLVERFSGPEHRVSRRVARVRPAHGPDSAGRTAARCRAGSGRERCSVAGGCEPSHNCPCSHKLRHSRPLSSAVARKRKGADCGRRSGKSPPPTRDVSAHKEVRGTFSARPDSGHQQQRGDPQRLRPERDPEPVPTALPLPGRCPRLQRRLQLRALAHRAAHPDQLHLLSTPGGLRGPAVQPARPGTTRVSDNCLTSRGATGPA